MIKDRKIFKSCMLSWPKQLEGHNMKYAYRTKHSWR